MTPTPADIRASDRKLAQYVQALLDEHAKLHSPSWEGVAAHREDLMSALFELLEKRLLPKAPDQPPPPFGATHMAVLMAGMTPDGVGMFHMDRLIGIVSLAEFDRIAAELARMRRSNETDARDF